ncbi:MAG: hypothetical protein V4708_17345, partial [Bacteroidota bacterium]
MRTNNSTNGGLKFYVSVIPALFPAIIFLSISTLPSGIRMQSGHSQMNTIAERVKGIYTSQIGVREKRTNSGPEVEQYLKYVNLPKGNPWCAAFVCWVYGRAGVGNPRSGWSPALFGEGRVIWRRGEQGTKSKEQRFGVRKFYNPVQNTADGINLYGRFAYPPSLTSGFRLLTS